MEYSRKNKKEIPIFRDRMRELQGRLTLAEFAEKVNVSRSAIGYYLNGDRLPDIEILSRIADAFDVTTDWLLGRGVKERSADMNQAHIFTGLSEDVVAKLNYYAHSEDESDKLFIEFINEYLSDPVVSPLEDFARGITAQEKKSPDNSDPVFDPDSGKVTLSSADTVDYYRSKVSKTFATIAETSVYMVFDKHNPQAARYLANPLYKKGE